MLHSSLTAKIERIDCLNTTKTCMIVHQKELIFSTTTLENILHVSVQLPYFIGYKPSDFYTCLA